MANATAPPFDRIGSAAAMTAACPVCLARFPEPVAFALHVLDCTAAVDSHAPRSKLSSASKTAKPSANVASCPLCHMVYDSETPAHAIEFHEQECAQVNERTESTLIVRAPPAVVATPSKSSTSESANAKPSTTTTTTTSTTKPTTRGRQATGTKRSRESSTVSVSSAVAVASSVKLFPSQCAVCDGQGRTMLKCAGKCARTFHPLCIEDINARDVASTALVATSGESVPFASAITRDKKAAKVWMCGECTRGLHPCQLCGFLGHEAHELVACSLNDCGFFFHPACLRAQNYRVQTPLVCPRHTCTVCHAIETDMSKCLSCSKCCSAQHIACQRADATASTRSRGSATDANFHVCDLHKPPASTKTSGSRSLPKALEERKFGQFAALKMNIRPGDVVLILEYNNLLLSTTAKTMAPDVANQWGIVQRVEQLGYGASPAWWTQLLTLTVFADNSTIDVMNQYVLPVSSMRLHVSAQSMVRESIMWHAMSEANVRALEHNDDAVVTDSQGVIIEALLKAFQARAMAVGLSQTLRTNEVKAGLTAWQAFANTTSRTYASSEAPVYLALDTRQRAKADVEMESVPESSTTNKGSGPHDGATGDDDDVDMEDKTDPTAPSDDKSSGTFGGGRKSNYAENVEDDVVVALARVVESVVEQSNRGRLLGGASDFDPEAQVQSATVASVVSDLVEQVVHSETIATSFIPQIDGEERVTVDREHEDDTNMSDDDVTGNQRLSMDDLLNPMSQDSVNLADSMPSVESFTPSLPSTVPKKRTLDAEEVSTTDTRDNTYHQVKKVKSHQPMQPPVTVKFTHLPVDLNVPRGSVFGRAPLVVPPPLNRKEKLRSMMPNVMMDELQTQVDAFFDSEEFSHDDWEHRVPVFRPAYYRPSPFLYCGPRVGRRVDGISRVLLCQDKRNLKCFIRDSTKAPLATSVSGKKRTKACRFGGPQGSTGRVCVTVDLIDIPGFAVLEDVLRGRIAGVVGGKEQSSPWHWQSSDHSTEETIEVTSTMPEIKFTYCAYDGSEHPLPTLKHRRLSPQHQPEWLCFCANVVHLTATILHSP